MKESFPGVNNLARGAGAFTTPEQMPSPGVPEGVPSAGPSASDPAAFLEQLKGLGLVPGGPSHGPSPVPSPGPSTMGSQAAPPGMAPMPPIEPPRPVKKGRFTPGKPGQPASGATAHQLMKDPDVVRTLHERISSWEAENPRRVLMGSHIQQMLPDVSASQARTIKRMLDRARTQRATGDLEGLLQQGAAKAMKETP